MIKYIKITKFIVKYDGDNMEETLIILESLNVEQYKTLFNNKPIYTPAIKLRKAEYIEMLSSGNEILKNILNKMLDYGVNIVYSSSNAGKTSIKFIISKEDIKFIKYIKEHIDANNFDLKIGFANNSYIINMEIGDIRNLIILNQIVESYLLVNPLRTVPDEDISAYILESYQPLNKESLAYLKETNKGEIMYIKEKYRQKSFQFGNDYFLPIHNPLQNNISIFEIYSKDNEFKYIPFEKLTSDMKYVMCNKYFQKVFEERLKILNQSLIEKYKIIFNVNFNKQNQLNLGNYGLTGNLPPFDNKIPDIQIFLYSNLNFCKIEKETASFNENLFGQVVITILHEHEHILQRFGLIDEDLKDAINAFELNSSNNSNYYLENYSSDPAELDANLTSFIRFNNVSRSLGITNPDNIIMQKVKNVTLNSEETFNFYSGSTINNINDVFNILNDNLDQSIMKYLNNGKKR